MSFFIWRRGANANVRRAVAARRRNRVERIMVFLGFWQRNAGDRRRIAAVSVAGI